MAGTSAVHPQTPTNVPRLALPSPETAVATGGEIDSSAFMRQINVALGRSHSQRTPRRDVVFNVKHGSMVEKNQRAPLVMGSSSARVTTLSGGCGHDSESNAFSTSRSHWTTSNQSTAPAFRPPSTNEPNSRWYEQADKVFRFFGYIVDQVEPTLRKAPPNVRLVIIHYYPQDSSLEMLESKETACPGVGRSIALRRPSRVSLDDIRVGSPVLINGTRVHVYDADGFTRRSIPGLRPPERPPAVDTTFSITPRRAPPPTSQNPAAMSASCNSPARLNSGGGGTGSISTMEAWFPSEGGDSSVLSEDPPGFLRMYIRWDESGSDGAAPTVHRYILHFFLVDGTVEMRELADIKGGNHFEGRFPVMIRRQKVFKGGGSPSLSVDRIGGDRADTGRLTPRSARANGTGVSSSVGSMSVGGGGAANDVDHEVGQPLTPLDLTVGKQVLLMKRPMTVCGWDETAHVWWERLTGTNMRGLQGDLADFRRCVRSSQSQPRPPTKPKSSFYEGPPQRPGTLRERFFKASENSGKTLRFLARATQDTKMTSTRDNVFIIRFYPEDDSLSVYTTHTLGSNSGGLYKGVYLARTVDMMNKDTGEPFKARDFYVGSVAKLPSVSLEIIDVDDFSRHYLAQETPPSDCQWQTAHIWARLLSLATSGGTSARAGQDVVAPTATADGDKAIDGFPCSPGKSVTFRGGDGRFDGTAAYLGPDSRAFEGLSRDNNSAFDTLSAATSFPPPGDHQGDGAAGPRSSVVFARLWAECIGDDSCAAFASDDRDSTSEGAHAKTRTHGGPEETPSPRQQHASPSLSNPRNLGPWERLVAVLRDERGVDVSRALTTHEQILLERDVVDWLQRAQGRKERGHEWGKGMSERLAAAAAAALRQGQPGPAATSERPPDSGDGEPEAEAATAAAAAAAKESRSSGGIPNVGRRRLSQGGFEFPAVVVEGSASPVGGSPERAWSRGPSARAGDAGMGTGAGAATSGSEKPAERQLDLRGVAVDAHETPASGRDDMFVQRALARVLSHVFGHGGEAAVLRTLTAEGKSPGDAADLWTMCRLLKIVAELSRRETEGLWLKFMPAAVAKAGEGGRVTFAGFLESIKAFEACLRRGELLGLSSIGRNGNCAGPLVVERSETEQPRRRV